MFSQKLLYKFGLVLILLSLFSVPAGSSAAVPDGAVPISNDDMFVERSASGTFTCALVGDDFLPGKLVGAAQESFLSFKAQRRNIKRELRSAVGIRRETLQRKLTRTAALIRAGTSVCADGPGGTTGTQPTPTPTRALGNFDTSGNVTDKGKQAFGIPSNLNANITSGKNFWFSICAGCHGERLNRSFSALRSSTQAAPMSFNASTLSDSTLAHITAYLNRFNP